MDSSDALVIRAWYGSLGIGCNFNAALPVDVASAERILIASGHAEAYGKALLVQLGMRGQEGDGSWSISMIPGVDHAKLATAPLAARVRAMVAVIRSLTPPPTATIAPSHSEGLSQGGEGAGPTSQETT